MGAKQLKGESPSRGTGIQALLIGQLRACRHSAPANCGQENTHPVLPDHQMFLKARNSKFYTHLTDFKVTATDVKVLCGSKIKKCVEGQMLSSLSAATK